jgi:NodT family efflux transporter outer membrane factor (OMF) lipoprotein
VRANRKRQQITRLRHARRFASRGVAGILAATMAGCAVGPNFKSPAPPPITSLSPTQLQTSRVGGPAQQAYVHGLDIPQRWWELFRCPQLNAILARAIDGNPDLEAATAAVRIAIANTNAAQGSFAPQIGASLGPSWQKQSPAQASLSGGGTSPYTISTAQISVSYFADVFGLNRRKVESLTAQAEAQHFELEATYLTLTSKLVLAAIQEAALRDEIAAAEHSITVAQEVLTLIGKQLDTHEATRLDVSAQEVALAQFQQGLQSLRKRLASNRDFMVALTGRFAGEGLPESFSFRCLHLPRELPLSLPSSIVRKRPDVRAAEANMHAATAEIGVAIANRLPQFNLTANVGASAAAIAKLASISSPLLLWSLAGTAAQTLFDGMSAEQRQRAAEAGLDRAAALYRSAVVTAFQNVADVLQAIEADRALYLAAERGAKAAQVNLDLTRSLLKQGLTNVLQVLSAQQMYAQAKSALAEAKAAQRADTVLLFQALGGGWSTPAPSPGTTPAWTTVVERR